MELEKNYSYIQGLIERSEKYTGIYREKITPNRNYAIKSFLYKSLNLDKHDVNLRRAFREYLCYESFFRLKSLEVQIYPDPLSEQLAKFVKTEGEENFEDKEEIGVKSLLMEVVTVRSANIFYITEIFALLHKVFYQNNYFHSLCFGDLIYEAKGVLVMLKIVSEKLLFYEDNIYSSKFCLKSEELGSQDLRIELCLNILYLLYNISYGIFPFDF